MSTIKEHVDLLQAVQMFEKFGFEVSFNDHIVKVTRPEGGIFETDVKLFSESVPEFKAMAKAFSYGFDHGVDMESLRRSK